MPDETLKLVRDLVEKAAEIKQLSFSRLLSHWKRQIATTLQRENALFILNSSAHVLYAPYRFDPECEPHLDEVLNQESIHCSYHVRLNQYLFMFHIIKQIYSFNIIYYIIQQQCMSPVLLSLFYHCS